MQTFNRNRLVASISLFGLANTVSPCLGQANTDTKGAYRNQLARRWAWTTEAWTGDDAPYRRIVAEVDGAVARGGDLERLLAEYKSQANSDRTDPGAQFQWAYLGYRLSLLPENRNKGIDKIGLSLDAMERAPSPHSYLYDRLRYLASHLIGASDYHMQNLGLRLLRRDPANRQLMLAVISDLGDDRDDVDRSKTRVIADRVRALALAQQYTLQHPEDPEGYGALGLVYSLSYLHSNSPSDQTKAIAAFNEQLKRTPSGSSRYQVAQYFVKKIQGGLVRYNGQYVYRETMPR